VIAQLVRIVVSVWLLLSGFGLIGMVVGSTVLGLIVMLSSFPFLRFHLELGSGSYPLGPILKYSFPMLGASLVVFFSSSVDIFVVMTLGSLGDLAYTMWL